MAINLCHKSAYIGNEGVFGTGTPRPIGGQIPTIGENDNGGKNGNNGLAL